MLRPDSYTPAMSAIGSLQCPIIVGRDELLELADRRLTEAAAGHGQLLLLAGEAGVGKTRLLGAIRRQARTQGFEVVNGSVAPQDVNVPTALIMDLARTFRTMPSFGSLGDDLLAQRVDETADALGSRRILVLDMVDRILSSLSGPILIDFEDIQWADDMSLEIIGELAKRVRDRPVLIVGAYRTEELPPGAFLREWRARLISQRLAEEVRLAPLTREQTALMTTLILNTGLPAPREVVQAVHERTNGFPLHIEELLGALDPDARIDGRKIREAQVPDTIEDAILARIAQLSPDAREVARAGAVIGRCFIPEVLAGIMDRPLSDLDTPLEELVQKSYLYDAGDPGWLDYRHQLLRDVLYRTVPPTELRRLHARAAEFGTTLDGQTEIHSSVHFERAGLRPQAYRSALSGAEKSGRSGSRRESFELYRRAVANIPDDLPLIDQAKLYQDYANAAEAIEHLDVVVEAATIARERFRAADRPVEAATAQLCIIGAARKNGSTPEERHRLLDEVFAELDALPASAERDQARLEATSYEVVTDLDLMELEEAAAANKRYEKLADALGDGESVLDVEFNAGMLDVVSGRVDTGLERLLTVAREGREHAWESTGVTAYRVHATMAARVMDYRNAEVRDRSRGSAMPTRSSSRIVASRWRRRPALMAWAAGRWDEAVGIANQELVERGCRRGVVGALDVLGYVALGRGDVDEARRWLDDIADTARMTATRSWCSRSLWGIAELALVAGDPAEAQALAAVRLSTRRRTASARCSCRSS